MKAEGFYIQENRPIASHGAGIHTGDVKAVISESGSGFSINIALLLLTEVVPP